MQSYSIKSKWVGSNQINQWGAIKWKRSKSNENPSNGSNRINKSNPPNRSTESFESNSNEFKRIRRIGPMWSNRIQSNRTQIESNPTRILCNRRAPDLSEKSSRIDSNALAANQIGSLPIEFNHTTESNRVFSNRTDPNLLKIVNRVSKSTGSNSNLFLC